MSEPGRNLLNWVDEAKQIANFVASERRVAHVRGSAQSHAHHFLHLIETVLRESAGSDANFCVLDPFDMSTNTPLGCLRTIVNELNVPVSETTSRASSHISAAIASNVRAFRDVIVNDAQVSQHISYNEGEEFNLMKDSLIEFLESGAELPVSVVVIAGVHHMEDSERRKFLSSLWNPLLRRLCGRGVKVVFMYCPISLSQISEAIPPEADLVIDLPQALSGEAVKDELASIISSAGWHPSGLEALTAATVLMSVSDTVADLYGNLAKLALRAR